MSQRRVRPSADRSAIIALNQRAARTLIIGCRYTFDPVVRCDGVSRASEVLIPDLQFGSGEYLGLSCPGCETVCEVADRFPPGSLLFLGEPGDRTAGRCYFGIDNLPGSRLLPE